MTSFEIQDNDLAPLKCHTVVLTGAASGIGLGTVKLLLDLGAYVVAGDLQDMPIEHDNLSFLKTNVTSWADLSALFKLATTKHGNIDHVFANAGISGRTTYLDEKLDENGELLEPTHQVFDINLKAVVNTTALAIHYIRRQDVGGSIVLTASASSFQRFRVVDYAAAKHAVLGLMRGLHPLLTEDLPNIRINAISPSWTTTGLVPEGMIERLVGIGTQTPAMVSRSVAILMADKQRSGQLIYSVEGKYSEIDGVLLKAAAGIVGNPNEDEVTVMLMKATGQQNVVNTLEGGREQSETGALGGT